MAATVVVYVNRNLETADAVAATASRHPGMRALDPSAAAEVLSPLVERTRPAAAQRADRRPDGAAVSRGRVRRTAAVEGRLDPSWLAQRRDDRQDADQPDARRGRRRQRTRSSWAIRSSDDDRRWSGVLGLSVHLEALERVLASIPLPPGSVVTLTDENSVVVARSLDARQYVGRSAGAGRPARNPFEVPASAILHRRSMASNASSATRSSSAGRGWPASASRPRSRWRAPWPIYQRNFVHRRRRRRSSLALSWLFGSPVAAGVRSSRCDRATRQPAAICRRCSTHADADGGDGSAAAAPSAA